MALSPHEFHDHARRAADGEGRLPLSRMTYWDIFPFEPDGLQVAPLRDPVLPEPIRHGEDGTPCHNCTSDAGVWRDDHWRLERFAPAGVPLLLMLVPRGHVDLASLDDDRARELGLLTVHISRAVEALPYIARAHVSRWGDGGAHLHVFFWARPEGQFQLRGSCLPVWDDLLPEYPEEVAAADAARVARAVADSYGGVAS